jgi:hypothetical protein
MCLPLLLPMLRGMLDMHPLMLMLLLLLLLVVVMVVWLSFPSALLLGTSRNFSFLADECGPLTVELLVLFLLLHNHLFCLYPHLPLILQHSLRLQFLHLAPNSLLPVFAIFPRLRLPVWLSPLQSCLFPLLHRSLPHRLLGLGSLVGVVVLLVLLVLLLLLLLWLLWLLFWRLILSWVVVLLGP